MASQPLQDSTNTRTPAFDLDPVYGGGPSEDRALDERMERGHAAKFRIEYGGLFEELPRSKDGTAIIADPRNDENLIIAGLHAAFLAAIIRLWTSLKEATIERRQTRCSARLASSPHGITSG